MHTQIIYIMCRSVLTAALTKGFIVTIWFALTDKIVAKCHHALKVEYPMKALTLTNSRTLLTIKKLDLPLPEAESFLYI